MSASEGPAVENVDGAGDAEPPDRAGALGAENRSLREERARARRTRYRNSAVTLVAVGLVAALAGLLFTGGRTVLLALGGTGVFLGILLYYLTPERLIAAAVGETVYGSLADNESQLVAELGLCAERVYLPPTREDGDPRLFVPRDADYEVPAGSDREDLFVGPADERARGVSLRPTAAGLFRAFRTIATDEPEAPSGLATALGDAVVEQFELADGVRAEVDAAAGRASIRVTDSALGRLDRFDHPIPSLFGVGFARALDRPVAVETTPVDDAEAEFVVTCSWDAEEHDADSATDGSQGSAETEPVDGDDQ